MEPNVIPRIAFELGPESSVWSVEGARTPAVGAVVVEELDMLDIKPVDVEVAEDEVDVTERTFCSLFEKKEVALIQPLLIVSNNAIGLSELPPEKTIVPLGPCAAAYASLVSFGAKLELYLGQSSTVRSR
jgi:hypothetical protein